MRYELKRAKMHAHSPTLNEEWVQRALSEVVCQTGVYDEGIVRNEVDKVQIFDTFILICYKNGS